jgi:hypothetical protein
LKNCQVNDTLVSKLKEWSCAALLQRLCSHRFFALMTAYKTNKTTKHFVKQCDTIIPDLYRIKMFTTISSVIYRFVAKKRPDVQHNLYVTDLTNSPKIAADKHKINKCPFQNYMF